MIANSECRTEPKTGSQTQKVKNDKTNRSIKQAKSVQRETHVTSREMDFFSQKELVNQRGHSRDEWLQVFLKETIDNALDACDDNDIPPLIEIRVHETGISVSDNGVGIPQSTVDAVLDFTVRASSREAYVSPDRGAQGNALMTLATMPYVVDPLNGYLEVISNGHRRRIKVSDDAITQRPQIHQDVDEIANHAGTTIAIHWKAVNSDVPFGCPVFTSAGWLCEGDIEVGCRQLIDGFRLFNPHASINLEWFGDRDTWQATNTEWKKWEPSKPSSAHWYDVEHLKRLLAACITSDRDRGEDRTVNDFLLQFDGLSGSRKRTQVLDECNMQRVCLSDFVADGQIVEQRIERLLNAMQKETKAVTPKRLGVIGEDHFREYLSRFDVEPESFNYAKKLKHDDDSGLPYVIETAFGYRGQSAKRTILPGVNWSAAIKNPFRSFGATGEGLDSYLSELYAGSHEPIVFAVHLAHPRIQYTDRGKSALSLSGTNGGEV